MTTDSTSPTPTSRSLFDYNFGTVSPDAEVLHRTEKTKALYGQASFFCLATKLGVPILNNVSNRSGGQDHLFVGAGASYGVTRPLVHWDDHFQQRSINITKSQDLEKGLLSRKFVTKRIIPIASKATSDAQQLAAITNEVRILGNETIKKANCLVKLLFVAWDELPREGRHWPRLLLEAADYGNLAAFMALSEDISKWNVKLELALNILGGLKMLHNLKVAHCDLKLENILVFQAEEEKQNEHGKKYRAKLCDFGFSVIMSDYEDGATFSAKLGTEPWNAPELTFGTEIKIDELPQADIFSFGLVFSRIYMHGGDPFEGMTVDETRKMKRDAEQNTMAMFEHVRTAIFARVTYSEAQQFLIQKLIFKTLGYRPEDRFPIGHIGVELNFLGVLYSE